MDSPDLGTVSSDRRWTGLDRHPTSIAHHREGDQQNQASTSGLRQGRQEAVWLPAEYAMAFQRRFPHVIAIVQRTDNDNSIDRLS